jgi:C4-dicarboxylate transporter/malic acid transport protein
MKVSDTHHHPAWFGSVMGTGALALAFNAQAVTWGWDWLNWLAVVTLALASITAVMLLPRYVRRLGDRPGLSKELANPAHGSMLATLPAGILVLATGWGRIGPTILPSTTSLWIDAVLLLLGAAIAVILGLAWSATMMQASPGLEGVNGGWLIPPVMNLLVPLALAPLIVANPEAAPLLLAVGFAFYGIGVILFLAVLSLLVARLALRDPMPPTMAASMWIPLAPSGMLGLSLMRLLQSGAEAGVPGFTGTAVGLAVASMGIGFGLWWAALAVITLRRMRQATGVPAHPGWWGFVFPIAAMALSITVLGSTADIGLIKVFGLLGTALLCVVWIYVAAKTVGMLGPAQRSATAD